VSLHIYTAAMQPAVAYVDTNFDPPMECGFTFDQKIYAHCCWKKRPAKNCVVQVYYDHMSIWCAEGHGCKHPTAVHAKQWKAHMNRSRAQQARRQREAIAKESGNG